MSCKARRGLIKGLQNICGVQFYNIDPDLNIDKLNTKGGRPSIVFINNKQKATFLSRIKKQMQKLLPNLEITDINKYFTAVSEWWKTSRKFVSHSISDNIKPKAWEHIPTALDKDMRFGSKLKFGFGAEINQELQVIAKSRSLYKLGQIGQLEMVMSYGGVGLIAADAAGERKAVCKEVKDAEGNIQSVEKARCELSTNKMALAIGLPLTCLVAGAINIGLGVGCGLVNAGVSIFMSLIPRPSFSLRGYGTYVEL
eukprot:Pgem_evm1s19376